jgi:hypothetical protein
MVAVMIASTISVVVGDRAGLGNDRGREASTVIEYQFKRNRWRNTTPLVDVGLQRGARAL